VHKKQFPHSRLLLPGAAVLAVGAMVASANPAVAGAAAPRSAAVAACRPAQLRSSVAAAVPGFPSAGMGQTAWNMLFRNTGSEACSLRGWPGVAVRTAAPVTPRVSDVTSNSIAQVPATAVRIDPGQSAVVTVSSGTSQTGCADTWTLRLTAPGGSDALGGASQSSVPASCIGGRLDISPFYPQQALKRDITALSVSRVPSPFPRASSPEPSRCAVAGLRMSPVTARPAPGGSLLAFQLRAVGRSCVLPQYWPTVRLRERDGSAPMAKGFEDYRAASTGRTLFRTYGSGVAERTMLLLRPGTPVSVDVLLPADESKQGACGPLASVKFYPSPVGVGAGLTAAVRGTVTACGMPRLLSFLPGGGTTAQAIAGSALLDADNAPNKPDGDTPSGYYYGTDSSFPAGCGSGPYNEPIGDCNNGTDGAFGSYFGMAGSWSHWEGCSSSGLAWDQTGYEEADANYASYDRGYGAGAYWLAAGPGRDPHYNGTTGEAQTWGGDQAQRFATVDIPGYDFTNIYAVMDVETTGSPDSNGWNNSWSSTCNGTAGGSISGSVDRADFNGFWNYIKNNTYMLPSVYSAGGGGSGSWSGIMGSSDALAGSPGTAIWTFTGESPMDLDTSADFPTYFSNSFESADWYGGVASDCEYMWQWAGGDGMSDGGYGDFDQIDDNNYGICN
jgi:Protein of unknown function (DUF4232)